MEENGYITVNVRTAGGALPVENAVVTVKDSGGAILAVFFTDRDGKTPRLKVLAPPRANSESPGAASPPFFNYNIDTDIPQAERITDDLTAFNPGSLSLPKGGYAASYGTYENNTLTVWELESGNIIFQTVLP